MATRGQDDRMGDFEHRCQRNPKSAGGKARREATAEPNIAELSFAGFSTDTPFYNLTLALAMIVGCFIADVSVLAIAGSLVAKRRSPPSLGTLPATGRIAWLIPGAA
jgi:hypothetical protein